MCESHELSRPDLHFGGDLEGCEWSQYVLGLLLPV